MASLLDTLNQKERDDVLNRIKQDFEWAEKARDERTSDWSDYRDQYDSKWVELTKNEDDENLDQYIYVPLTYKTVHRIECALRSHFLPPGDRRLGRVTGTVATGETQTAADIADKVLHAKVDIELSPARDLQDSWNAGLVEGTGVLKGGWKRDRAIMPDGSMNITNRALLEYVPNEHCCHDPNALSPNEITFWCQEMWLTADELWDRQLRGIYEDVHKVLEDNKGESRAADPWYTATAGPTNPTRELYRIVEFWGTMQLVGPDELRALHAKGEHVPSVDIVATFHSDRVLLRLDINPYAGLFDNPTPYEKLPIWLCTPLPRRGSTYGDGMAARLKALQREENTLRNQRRQAVDMEMTAKVLYDRNRGIDLPQLDAARFGGRVAVNGDPNSAVSYFVPKTTTGNMAQEEAIIEADARHVSGVMETHMGESPQGQDTATGISIITQEGNVKLDNILQNVADSQVVPMQRFFVECIKEWMSPEEIQDIIGSQQPPPPIGQVLRHDYRVEVEAGVSATSKAVRLRNHLATVQTLGQIANAMPNEAMAAMAAIMPELLRLQGVPEAAAIFSQALEQTQGAQGPAAQQTPSLQNFGNEQAMAMQGRSPMPEERRLSPGR